MAQPWPTIGSVELWVEGIRLGFEVRHPGSEEADARGTRRERAWRKGREHLRELGHAEAQALWRDLRRGTIRHVEGIHVPLAIGGQLDRLDRLRNVEFRSADVPLLASGGRFQSAEWRDCRFDDVALDAWFLEKARVVGCTFDRLDLGRADPVLTRDSTFEDCEFRKSHAGEAHFERVAFRRTRFADMEGGRVRWEDCVFDDVVASGRLDRPHLLRCDFRATDLADLHLLEGTLMGTFRTDVVLPAHDDSFAVPPDVFTSNFREVLPGMSERSRDGVAALDRQHLLEVRLRGSGNGEVFWNPGLIADIFDIELADARRVAERLTPYRMTRPA